MDNELDIDALLAEAAAQRIEPSAALIALIVSDAEVTQPQPFVFKPVFQPPTTGFRGWFPGLAEGLGGARAVAGLSFVGLTGLFLGVAEPTALQSFTSLLSGATVQIEQMDLLPATDGLWTEN